MKAWLAVLPIAIALPAAAWAQTSTADNARAAELACKLGGLCGAELQAELDREKEKIEGVVTRGGMPTWKKIRDAGKSIAGAQVGSANARQDPSPRAQVTRPVKRNIPATLGRGASSARGSAMGAANVPDSIAGRSPLFVTFGLNSSKLTADSSGEVKEFARALKLVAASGRDKRFRVEGHTDASGSEAFNRALSEQRAAAVRAALVAEGIEFDRIEVVGFGSDKPIDGFAKGNPINRRVEAVEIK